MTTISQTGNTSVLSEKLLSLAGQLAGERRISDAAMVAAAALALMAHGDEIPSVQSPPVAPEPNPALLTTAVLRAARKLGTPEFQAALSMMFDHESWKSIYEKLPYKERWLTLGENIRIDVDYRQYSKPDRDALLRFADFCINRSKSWWLVKNGAAARAAKKTGGSMLSMADMLEKISRKPDLTKEAIIARLKNTRGWTRVYARFSEARQFAKLAGSCRLKAKQSSNRMVAERMNALADRFEDFASGKS